MQDCRLIITVRDDKIKLDRQDVNIVELAEIAGHLQVIVGIEALRRGMDLDDVKNNLYDIYFAAMEILWEQLRAGNIDQDSSHERG